jgi:hypothetical protein
VSHGVDPVADRVKVTSAYASVDSIFTEAFLEKLPAPHHPMLSASDSRNKAGVPAKPHQPALKTG